MRQLFHTPVLHFDDVNGRPLVGGRLYSYKAGTSKPVNLFRNETGSEVHTNPIVLNMRGECVAYGVEGLLYKLVLKDRHDVTIWERDNVGVSTGEGGGGGTDIEVSYDDEGKALVFSNEFAIDDPQETNEVEKIVDGAGLEFDLRDNTKEALANKVTSVRNTDEATDTNYPSEHAVSVGFAALAAAISTLWTNVVEAFQTIANKVTSIRAVSSASDDKYPTEKAVASALASKLDATATAAKATKLETARTIGISGPVTGTATSFDGSANITIPVTKVGFGTTNANNTFPFGASSLCGPRSGNSSLPYVQWAQFTGKAFTVGGTTYYGYVLAPSSSVTVSYGGGTATITNSHGSNYNVIIVLEESTYLGSATFTGRDRCAPTLDGVGFRSSTIANNVSVGTGTAVVVNVGGSFTMASATSSAKLLAAKAVASTGYSGNNSMTSGNSSVASGNYSVALGVSSVASGNYSVALGAYSIAFGNYSVASGVYSVASGNYSVALGVSSVASGNYSVASGVSSVVSHDNAVVTARGGRSGEAFQTVIGKNNEQVSNAAFVIGWGSSESSRKNIAWVGTDGDIYFKEGETGLTAQLAAKQASLPTTGQATDSYAINISGSSASCTGNAATASAAASGSALETVINGKAASSHTHKTDAADVTSDDTNLDDATDGMQFVTTYADNTGYSSQHKELYRRPGIKIWNWIKSKIDSYTGVVHTTGDETIQGLKTFSNTTAGNDLDINLQSVTNNGTYKMGVEIAASGRMGLWDYDGTGISGEGKWIIFKDTDNVVHVGDDTAQRNKVKIGGITFDSSGTIGTVSDTLYIG